MLTHAGLFSGIGGFSLAARWMGWQNVFEVEKDPFCRQVLHKNFPESQLFEDVCLFSGLPFRGRIDVLSGGFPCQPFSDAGRGLGAEDSRHLWPQMLRIIRECQPPFVVGENVRGLLTRHPLQFERVCADLEAEGYDVLPLLLPASAVGAPHQRYRLWFVAHARRFWLRGEGCRAPGSPAGGMQAAHGQRERLWADAGAAPTASWPPGPGRIDSLPRLPDGLPARLVRPALKAYGNAIVPHVAYQIFRAIAADAPTLEKTPKI